MGDIQGRLFSKRFARIYLGNFQRTVVVFFLEMTNVAVPSLFQVLGANVKESDFIDICHPGS